MRKIIQIAVASSESSTVYTLIALCDDGSVWKRSNSHPLWLKTSDIPQDKLEDNEDT